MLNFRLALAVPVLLLAQVADAQTLQLISGQGQVVQQQFPAQPFRVRAVNSAGQGVPGVQINFSVEPGQAGTLLGGSTRVTDENGYAEIGFFGSSPQQNVSFLPFTITASSSAGNVVFSAVLTVSRLQNGTQIPLPGIQVLAPIPPASLEGAAGTTLPGAVRIRVYAQGGLDVNKGVPNVGLRVEPIGDNNGTSAVCNGPGGVALTNQEGFATCDLVLGPVPGLLQLRGTVGEYWPNIRFDVNVTPGAASCTFSVTPNVATFTAAGGGGSVTLSTGATCAWTTQSNSSWISPAQPSGVGPATINFSVGPNAGTARSGSFTVAGQTVTINQSGTGPGSPLSFLVGASLPSGVSGSVYSSTLGVTGGTPPYTWSATGLPPGLSLHPSTGVLSGTPSATGTFSLPVTVRDTTNAQVSQTFSISISQSGGGGNTGNLAITNTSFPNGVVRAAYQQGITTTGGCSNPFGGAPQITLSGGTLPPGLAVELASNGFAIAGTPTQTGTYQFTLQATACGAVATRAYSITITPAAGSVTLTANPASLSVNGELGARPTDREVQISSSGDATAIQATATTANGGNWLAVSPSPARAPGTLNISFVNYESLTAGTYNGQITVTAANAIQPVVIPVTLVVSPAVQLIVNPRELSFEHIAGAVNASEQVVGVTSSVPGVAAAINVSTTTSSGGNWLGAVRQSTNTPSNVRVQVNSQGLAPGTYEGTVAISAVANPLAVHIVRVTLRVSPAATAVVTPVSLAFTYDRSALPASQTLTVQSSGVPFTFSASATTQSGGSWLSVTPTQGSTPGTLTVSVQPTNLQAGSYQGTITVVPETTRVPVVVGVQLVVTGTLPQIGAVTNAASFAVGGVSPGEMVTIFGTNLGPASLTRLQLTSAGRIDVELAGTRVFFNDIPAPLIYTSANAITATVPYGVAGSRTARVQVEYGGVRSLVTEVAVVESAVGVFAVGGTTQGSILNQDTTANSLGNGAEPESFVSIFATGEGLTSPASTEGVITGTQDLPRPLLGVSVTIGGLPAEIQYAGAAPVAPAGMMQVNARVPAGVPRGAIVPVVLTVGSSSSPTVTLVTR